jgi:hypothetical protein
MLWDLEGGISNVCVIGVPKEKLKWIEKGQYLTRM